MIHIFFVPGMFGSTVEHVLRDFTHEMKPTNAELYKDGSMHTFKKQNHPYSLAVLNRTNFKDINTPTYPFRECGLPTILQNYPSDQNDHCILLYAKTFNEAEQNMLFVYYKISLVFGQKMFYSNIAKQDLVHWNPKYSDYKDLTPWEFREWFSIFYPGWISEWQQSVHQVPDDWLKISCGDILSEPQKMFENVISYCKLTKKPGIDEFAKVWQQAQQYITKEYQSLDHIVDCVITQQNITWNPLNYISESIIQKKLRDHGYEIRCDGLDIFPTNSLDLYNLLDDSLKLHHKEI